ncbi:MAG: LolA family protein [Pirellulaceae bacterium]
MSAIFKRWRIFLAAMAQAAFIFVSGTIAQELLEEVRAGNKAALESIRTLSCRITVATPLSPIGPKEASTADYWQSADSLRVRCSVLGRPSDMVRHEFVTKKLMRSGTQTIFVIERADPDDSASHFDAYKHGLLKLFGPPGQRLTLDEILRRPHKLGNITRQPYQGHACVVLKMSAELTVGKNTDFEIWFDPQVNYLACKLIRDSTRRADQLNVHSESQVLRFTEAAPGIYFPAQTERKSYTDGKLTQHDIVTFSDVRINQPLPPNIFELPIPPGVTVIDEIQDREYQVDAGGKAIGPGRSLPKVMPLAAGSGKLPGNSKGTFGVAQVETTAEPKPVTRWIIYAFLFVLVVTGSIWYVGRLREGAKSG